MQQQQQQQAPSASPYNRPPGKTHRSNNPFLLIMNEREAEQFRHILTPRVDVT